MKQIFLIWLIFIPGLIIAQPNPTIQAFKAEKLFVQGRALYERGNYEGAIELFNQVIELDDNHQMVFEMRGDALYELGRYREALADYRDASRIHPDNAELRNNMGVVSAQLGMYAAATSYFREALDIDPDHETAQENLTKAQLRAQQNSAFNGQIASNSSTRKNKLRNQIKGKAPIRTPSTKTRPNNRPTTKPRPKVQTPPPRFPHSYEKDRREIEVGKQTDPFLNIIKVQVTQNYTRVTFELESTGDETFQVKLEGKNSRNAFYITDRAMNRSFKLVNIRNLRGWPKDPYVLHPNDPPLVFVAEFEKIEEDMKIFHILEGQQERAGTWDFWDVKLID